MSHIKDMERIKRLPTDFLKCGITGWCLEVIFTSVESILNHDWRLMGRTSLLMFPIYGCGALLGPLGSLAVTDRMIRHGMIYMVLIFTAEYISGSFLRARGICPWDYTGKSANVDGLIRLDFAPLWFGVGLLFEQITKKRGR